MIKILHRLLSVFGLLLCSVYAHSQQPSADYPFLEGGYDFVRYDLNRITQFKDSSRLERFYGKMDLLFSEGKGQINIVQFGGSHVQADIHTGRLRTRLQTFYPGVKGSRGFLFPFKAAGTNNPYNYTVQYFGSWKGCRNVQAMPCDLGVAGISATTSDSLSGFTVFSDTRYAEPYDFNRFRIYHNTENLAHDIEFYRPEMVKQKWINEASGFTEFVLNGYADTLGIKIARSPYCTGDFTIFGFQMFNDDPGFVFHSIGVNGAAVPSYLKCVHFVKHLRELQPDLVIFGIGVNDAHGNNFSPAAFEANYTKLIAMVRDAAPNTAILFVSNNDTYFKKRYVNHNAVPVLEVMTKIASRNGYAVWDLFSIMGGYGSMAVWDRNGLAASDRIHFTRPGYTLIGDLMFDALLKGYIQHVQKKTKKN